MPRTIQNGRHPASVQATATRAPQVLSPENRARADQWRDALRRLLVQHQLSPAELARRIEAPNPNFLYNFLNSRSHSLAQDTLERICRALPGTEISDLFGAPRPRSATCMVIAEALIGVAQASFMLSPARQQPVSLPGALSNGIELFGVRVGLTGAGRLYPAGSILLCCPYSGRGEHLQTGCRAIMQQPLGEGLEVTVRELVVRGPGEPDQAATDPHRAHLPLPAAIALSGVVIASWQPEPASIAA